MKIALTLALLVLAAGSARAQEFDAKRALTMIGACAYTSNAEAERAAALAAYWKAYVEGLAKK